MLVIRKCFGANPSPEGRGWPEGPGEGYHMKTFFIRYPSPGASHHPLPSGEGFAPKHFPVWTAQPGQEGRLPHPPSKYHGADFAKPNSCHGRRDGNTRSIITKGLPESHIARADPIHPSTVS